MPVNTLIDPIFLWDMGLGQLWGSLPDLFQGVKARGYSQAVVTN
jgi:hypothetical protein